MLSAELEGGGMFMAVDCASHAHHSSYLLLWVDCSAGYVRVLS